LEYYRSLYGRKAPEARLEEVELTDDGQYWLITLSYPDPDQISWDLGGKREYKVFKIAEPAGEVKSMKIRKVG
jgi:hypothetical protein